MDNILDLGVGLSLDASPFNNSMDNLASVATKSYSAIYDGAATYLGSQYLLKVFKNATLASSQFGQSMADMAAITDLNISKISASIKQLPNVLGNAAKIADTMYEIISSGFRDLDASNLMRFQEAISISSKVIRADVYSTGNAITTLANAYKLNIDEVERLSDWFYMTVREGKAHGDELARTMGLVTANAAEGGVRIKELGAAIAILSRTQTTSQSMIGLNQAINAIIAPTIEAEHAIKKWNIDMSATTLQNKGLAYILKDIHNKLQGNTTAIEELFGNIRAGRAILALTGNQYKDFTNTIEMYASSTGEATKAFATQIDTLNTALETFDVQNNKTAIQIGEDLEFITKNALKLGEAISKGFADAPSIARYGAYIIALVETYKKFNSTLHTVTSAIKNVKQSLDSIRGVGATPLINIDTDKVNRDVLAIKSKFDGIIATVKLLNFELMKVGNTLVATDKVIINVNKTLNSVQVATTRIGATIKSIDSAINILYKKIVEFKAAVDVFNSSFVKVSLTVNSIKTTLLDINNINKQINVSVNAINTSYKSVLATIKAINIESAKMAVKPSRSSKSKAGFASTPTTASPASYDDYIYSLPLADNYLLHDGLVVPENNINSQNSLRARAIRKQNTIKRQKRKPVFDTSTHYPVLYQNMSPAINNPYTSNMQQALLMGSNPLLLGEGAKDAELFSKRLKDVNTSLALTNKNSFISRLDKIDVKGLSDSVDSTKKGLIKINFSKIANGLYSLSSAIASAIMGWSIGKEISKMFDFSNSSLFKSMQTSKIGGALAGIGQFVDNMIGGGTNKVSFGAGTDVTYMDEANRENNRKVANRLTDTMLATTKQLTESQKVEFYKRLALADTLDEAIALNKQVTEVIGDEYEARVANIDSTKQLTDANRKLVELRDAQAKLLTNTTEAPISVDALTALSKRLEGYGTREQTIATLQGKSTSDLDSMYSAYGGTDMRMKLSNVNTLNENSLRDFYIKYITDMIAKDMKTGQGANNKAVVPQNIIDMLSSQNKDSVLQMIKAASKSGKSTSLGGVMYSPKEAEILYSQVRGVLNEQNMQDIDTKSLKDTVASNAEAIINQSIGIANIIYRDAVDKVKTEPTQTVDEAMMSMRNIRDEVLGGTRAGGLASKQDIIQKDIVRLSTLVDKTVLAMDDKLKATTDALNEQLAKGTIDKDTYDMLLVRAENAFMATTTEDRKLVDNATSKLKTLREQLLSLNIKAVEDEMTDAVNKSLYAGGASTIGDASSSVLSGIKAGILKKQGNLSKEIGITTIEASVARGTELKDLQDKLIVLQTQASQYTQTLSEIDDVIKKRDEDTLAWYTKEADLGRITESELLAVRKKDAERQLKNAKYTYNLLENSGASGTLLAKAGNAVVTAEQLVSSINLELQNTRKKAEQGVMGAIQGFTADKDKRGQLSNTALYHSLDLLSRISPQLVNTVNRQAMMTTGYSNTSANISKAQGAQKQVAVAMDAYVMEQKREAANVGKNVKLIADILQETPPIRINN